MITEIIKTSQAYPSNIPIDDAVVIDRWLRAKDTYIRLFNGNTSILLAKDIELHLSKEDKLTQFYQFIETLSDSGVLTDELEHFLFHNKTSIFSNKIVYPKDKEGYKLSKYLKNYISDPKILRQTQDLLSEYIQADSLRGDLVLSVDILDFLTASENTAGWRSCHRLDGNFRSGNLSLALDDTTLILYFAPKQKVQLPVFPQGQLWNNKIWRMFIHTNNFQSIIYWDRQYPFSNDNLLSIAYGKIKELFPNFSSPQTIGIKTLILNNGVRSVLDSNLIKTIMTDEIYDTRDIIHTEDSLAYSDLISSPTYLPMVSIDITNYFYKRNLELNSTLDRPAIHYNNHMLYDIKIGAEVPCLSCGDRNITNSSSFLCANCLDKYHIEEDFFPHCVRCGCRRDGTQRGHALSETKWYCNKCFNLDYEYKEGLTV